METGPHYLNFVSHEVPEGDTRFKCAPPLRGAENRDALWQGLADSLIDSVASDHSPAPPDMKSFEDGDFNAAWGGIAGPIFALTILRTAAVTSVAPFYSLASDICDRTLDFWLSELNTHTYTVEFELATEVLDYYAGLQYNLPATWHGMSTRGLGPEMLAKWFSEAPAKLAGLGDRKGSIALGYDADFVVRDLTCSSRSSAVAARFLVPSSRVFLAKHIW